MQKLTIKLKETERQYPILFEMDFSKLVKVLNENKNISKILIVTDTNVDKYYGDEVKDLLMKGEYETYKCIFEAGEANKLLTTVSLIYDKCLEYNLDRDSLIIALGGGVTGDIAGFVASTYMRGIDFAQIPTTLLAQVDSSVGGKVGVDYQKSKNIIGAFYQPVFVYTNVNTLHTLPKREFISGMAEVIKHGIIYDPQLFKYIEDNVEEILSLDSEALKHLIYKNCFIKSQVVQQDEREKGLRVILNFGHTIGHGIESVLNFSMLHGECVSIGMVAAAFIAYEKDLLTYEEYGKIVELLQKVGLPVKIEYISEDKIYQEMLRDKKKQQDKLRFILPVKIGDVIQTTEVIQQDIFRALKHVFSS